MKILCFFISTSRKHLWPTVHMIYDLYRHAQHCKWGLHKSPEGMYTVVRVATDEKDIEHAEFLRNSKEYVDPMIGWIPVEELKIVTDDGLAMIGPKLQETLAVLYRKEGAHE